jgi:hypothetical protein
MKDGGGGSGFLDADVDFGGLDEDAAAIGREEGGGDDYAA